MVSQASINAQLQRIGFSQSAWGRAEIRELPNIILPDEEIFECVNGMYEGGFALLVATDVRVLLIDKKPFNYLTVEDLRFDMINEIDYNHRAFGAYVEISTGNRDLKFRSYNQARLRKLISHVQNCMADIKRKQVTHQEGQYQHLQQINGHLKTYLIAQQKHQLELQRQLEDARRSGGTPAIPEAPRPDPELSDYLLAHGLLEQYAADTGQKLELPLSSEVPLPPPEPAPEPPAAAPSTDDLYAEGVREVFGDHNRHPFDVNPLRIAYAKLPMVLHGRKFGRPSLRVPHVTASMPSMPVPGVPADLPTEPATD
ncbi:MAG TPA: PH domain-containing protein [Candidatus Saccharimonadales bacterium]|nr:PH domain-containing protein [Candidatus Saccharimonadales bacterium]